MSKAVLSSVSLILLLSFTLMLGLFSFSGHHGAGCPFMTFTETLCATPFEHVSHWKTILTAVLQALIAAVAVFFAVFPRQDTDPHARRYRFYAFAPRPTLMQDLFADGILNPKIPQFAFAEAID